MIGCQCGNSEISGILGFGNITVFLLNWTMAAVGYRSLKMIDFLELDAFQ
jgi:hypothetical protein